MADLYSAEYKKAHVDIPKQMLSQNEQGGKLIIARAKHTFAGEPSALDKIKMIKLPKGAKVIEAIVHSPDLGTTGVFNLGYSAPANGAFVGDLDAFIPTVTVTSAVSGLRMSSQVAGLAGRGLELTEEVDVEFHVATVTDAADGLAIELELHYVLKN
jgi:hypothetical protein